VNGYIRYGNNGEDFISFDMDTETWIISDAKAEAIKKKWDGDEGRNVAWKLYLSTECPTLLKFFLTYGKSYLTRKGKVKWSDFLLHLFLDFTLFLCQR